MGLLFAYCVRFLKLVALLWGGTSAPVHREAAVHLTSPLLGMIESTEFLWYFVDILYLLTSINVLKVTCFAKNSIRIKRRFRAVKGISGAFINYVGTFLLSIKRNGD